MQFDKEAINMICTIGPQMTLSDVQVDAVDFSIFSGKGIIKGLVIGNPAGFQSLHAIKVPEIEVAIKITSLFSDRIIIQSLKVKDPEITMESGPSGINLENLINNVEKYANSHTQMPSEKNVRVAELSISTGKVLIHDLGSGRMNRNLTVPFLSFKDLESGHEGQSLARIALHTIRALFEHVMRVVKASIN